MQNQPAYFAEHRIRFEYRKSQLNKPQLPGTIYALIYVEGQKEETRTTGIRCSRADWDNRTSPGRSQVAKDLNEKLVLWERSISQAARVLLDRGDAVTAGSLLDEKNHINQPLLTLQAVFEKFLAHKRTLVGPKESRNRLPHQIAPDTYESYEKRWKWLTRYLSHKRQSGILLLKVDAPFVHGYYYHLTAQSLGAAYATKCVKLLTEVCQWAFNAGHSRELRTGGFRGSNQAVTGPYNLTEADICRMESLVLDPYQTKVRDAFLLARELCLHYSDYREMKPEHFSRDSQGRLIFEKLRWKQESGRSIKIVTFVSDRAQRIWNQYGQKVPAPYTGTHLTRGLVDIGLELELPRRLCFSHARDSGIFRLVAQKRSEMEIKLAAGWTSTRNLIKYVSHDRALFEELTKPTSPHEGLISYQSPKENLTPDRHNPFLHIYKAS